MGVWLVLEVVLRDVIEMEPLVPAAFLHQGPAYFFLEFGDGCDLVAGFAARDARHRIFALLVIVSHLNSNCLFYV